MAYHTPKTKVPPWFANLTGCVVETVGAKIQPFFHSNTIFFNIFFITFIITRLCHYILTQLFCHFIVISPISIRFFIRAHISLLSFRDKSKATVKCISYLLLTFPRVPFSSVFASEGRAKAQRRQSEGTPTPFSPQKGLCLVGRF